MKAYIITGASRGLGEALTKEILETEKRPALYCISRKSNDKLIDLALEKNVDLSWINYDLSDLIGLSEIMEDIMGELEDEKELVEGIYLINNAGVVNPVKPIENAEAKELVTNVHVNLLAPMILTGEFIAHTKSMAIEKRVLNISSGAAEHGYYGWSAYCATKAGINLFTQAVGIEQGYREHEVKILSVAPGIVDTGMQEEIRGSKEEDFRDLDRFIGFKENGDLVHPEVVAKDIIGLLHSDRYPQGANLDVRTMEKELWKH